jgi:transposase
MSQYSLDLRQKVIKYVQAGNTQRAASTVFNLSKTTVNAWCKRYKSEGHCCARKHLGAAPRIEKDSFIKHITENPNATSEEIGREFGISASGARYWLRRIGFSYKKKPLPTWKQIKKSEINTKKL